MTTQSQPRDPAADDTLIRAPLPPEPAPPRPRRGSAGRRPRLLAIVGAVVGLLVLAVAAVYVVGYAVAGDRLPKNASVAGVGVGGLDRDAAVGKLTAELGPRARRHLVASVAGHEHKIDPAKAGLGVDYPASIARAGGGRSLDPRQIWRVLTGGAATKPVVAVDQTKLRAAVAALAERTDMAPKNAALAYDDHADVKVTKAVRGVRLNSDDAARELRVSYLRTDQPVRLEAAVSEPEVTTAEVEKVADSFARPAVAAPVTVEAKGAGRFEVTPAMIASAVRFEPKDGTLDPRLDAAELYRQAHDALAKVELTKPKDATVRLENGRPTVIPAVNGTAITAGHLAAAVEPALPEKGTDARTVSVELTGAKAKFSTADAEKLGVKKVTGEFTTRFPYAEYRNINIGRAAEKINNTLLKPGEVFSLNGVVGERTRANGFTEGFIIKGGRFRKDLGGGVSQSATTTFNAMFFAGLRDIQHQPHGLYINRYPAGREATVAWPSLDLKFENDTRYGVLVQAFVEKSTPSRQGSITVRMWSTKTYDKVVSSALRRSNFTTGRDITDSGPKCEPTEPVPGFDVDFERLFYSGGTIVKREPFHWRYAPTDKVTCK